MAKRLNDTSALVARGIRGGEEANPDLGRPECYQGPRPYETPQYFDARVGDLRMRLPRSPDAGSESLRGATAYLGERIGK